MLDYFSGNKCSHLGTFDLSLDFNNILNSDERLGSLYRISKSLDFRDIMDSLQLTHIISRDCFYSFCNKQGQNHRLLQNLLGYKKLSLVVGYEKAQGDYILSRLSDLFVYQLYCNPTLSNRPKPFKLFSTVMHHHQFFKIIASTWTHTLEPECIIQLKN